MEQAGGLEHEQILTIVNNLADAVFSIDMKGVIQLYNAAGLNLLDTNTSIEGKRLGSVFKLEDEDGKPINLFERVKGVRVVTVDDSLRMRSGDDIMRLELTYRSDSK
jgi:PAS domain-containing protein